MVARSIPLIESKFGDRISSLNYVSEAYVIKVEVKEEYPNFHLTISGRSRFCNYLPKSKFLTYSCYTRYKDLKKVHNDLMVVLKRQTKAHRDILTMPDFPSESSFKKGGGDTIMNEYFTRLYHVYGHYVIYSEALINLCKPISIDILILPAEKEVRNLYLNNAVRQLFNLSNLSFIKEKVNEDVKDSGKSLWKKYVPFDYLVKEQLFRIDFVNQHLSVKSQKLSLFNLLKYSPYVIVLADGTKANYMKDLKTTLTNIGNNTKALQAHTDIVIAFILNGDPTDVEDLGSVLGTKTKFACVKCLTTGEDLLKPFDILLNYYT